MVEDKNSVEKRRKKPIRNVPSGFQEKKDSQNNPVKSVRNVPRGFKEAKEQASGQAEKAKEEVLMAAMAADISVQQKNEEIFNQHPNENKTGSNYRPPAGKAHRNKLITFSVIAAVILLVFVFRPGLLGLGVYDEGKTNGTLTGLVGLEASKQEKGQEENRYSVTDLGDTLEKLKLEISSGNEKLSEFLENDISRITGDLVSCLTEKSSLEDNYEEDLKSLEDDLEKKKQELEALKAKEDGKCSELESRFTSLENSFDLLALNSARSICCKQKVDNWDIDYYEVVDDKIVCLEEGNKSLNCFS